MRIRMTVILLMILVGCGACTTRTPFQWDQLAQNHNTASLKLIELSRERRGAFTVVTYRVEAVGFPVGKPLELWMKNIIRSEEAKYGTVVVDEQGTVRWQSTDTGAPVGLVGLIAKGVHAATDSLRGKEVIIAHGQDLIAQRHDWALFEKESGQVAVAKVIPFSLVAEGPGGCRLSVELWSPNGMFFQITAEGFQANEDLTFTSQSDEEVIRKGMKYPSNGSLLMGYLPGVVGKNSGEATITFGGTRCTVSSKVNWGQAALVVQ